MTRVLWLVLCAADDGVQQQVSPAELENVWFYDTDTELRAEALRNDDWLAIHFVSRGVVEVNHKPGRYRFSARATDGGYLIDARDPADGGSTFSWTWLTPDVVRTDLWGSYDGVVELREFTRSKPTPWDVRDRLARDLAAKQLLAGEYRATDGGAAFTLTRSGRVHWSHADGGALFPCFFACCSRAVWAVCVEGEKYNYVFAREGGRIVLRRFWWESGTGRGCDVYRPGETVEFTGPRTRSSPPRESVGFGPGWEDDMCDANGLPLLEAVDGG